jgi:predicted glutamine amidotransferase
MCAIIGWKGDLPKGLLSHLLEEAQRRGKDSTGIGYRTTQGNLVTYRQAVRAETFVKDNSKVMSEARRQPYGIAHTRRASKGMPVDNRNAHPFVFAGYVFAHNGKVDNWKELKDKWINHYKDNENCKKYHDYFLNATTDSMVLGPYIKARNFEEVEGCLGLTWIKGNDVYAFHSAKELVGATILWNYTEGDDQATHTVTVVASTIDIIGKSLSAVRKISSEFHAIQLDENKIYKLTEAGLVDEGCVPYNAANHADNFTSEVLDPDTSSVILPPNTP